MIIRGKEFSEETIVEALQKHCNFEEKKYIFKAGDVVINKEGEYRVIVQGFVDDLVSYDKRGGKMSSGQKEFEYWEYKKVGTLEDYIN